MYLLLVSFHSDSLLLLSTDPTEVVSNFSRADASFLPIRRGEVAFDVGAEAGWDSRYLVQQGFDVVAVDRPGESIAPAAERRGCVHGDHVKSSSCIAAVQALIWRVDG